MTLDRSRPILGNPFFLGALGLLILNDQFLKSHFGNAITGKLSDFAGLFVVGFLVVGMARHHQRSEKLALLPIVIIFSAAKTLPAVTSAIVAGLDLLLPWANAVVTDPSDLIALLVLPLAPIALDQKAIRLRTWAKNALLLTTVVACTATSQLHPDPVNLGVTEDGQVVSARDSDVFDFSQDSSAFDVEARLADTSETVTVPNDLFKNREPQTHACAAIDIDHCFQIDAAGTIQESLDGGTNWSTIWKIDPDSYASLVGARGEAPNFINPLTPRDLEVTPDGDLITIVGDSTLVSRTRDGVWTNPDSDFRPMTFPLVIQLFLTSIVLYTATALGLKMFRPKMLWVWIPLMLLATITLGFGIILADPTFLLFELLALLLAGVAGLVTLLAFRRPKVDTTAALVWGLVVPPVLTMSAALPVAVWKYANFGTFETTAVLSALATLVLAELVYLTTKQIDRTTIPLASKTSAPPTFVPPPAT